MGPLGRSHPSVAPILAKENPMQHLGANAPTPRIPRLRCQTSPEDSPMRTGIPIAPLRPVRRRRRRTPAKRLVRASLLQRTLFGRLDGGLGAGTAGRRFQQRRLPGHRKTGLRTALSAGRLAIPKTMP